MRSKFQLALFAIIATLIVSCSADKKAETVDLEKVKVEIQAMEDAYAAAEKSKDANAVMAYYDKDAVSYHPNEAPTAGHEATKAFHANRLAKDTTGNTNVYKVVDLFGDGDNLVEVGSWTELSPSGAEVNKGYYMSYFQKKDGKWVCVRDMNASANPAK